ncbi:MAG: class I SAM-dependent methyltransferase [Pirellulales bacterium]|nr:class I SAM-dependent methyltransferase [Pirellulales bacterium]
MARRMLQAIGSPPVALVLWDGDVVCSAAGPPKVSVVIHDRATLLKIAVNPLFNFGEAYSNGQVELEGSLGDLLDAFYSNLPGSRSPGLMAKTENLLEGNSLRGSRLNIHHHYDIGDDFFELWLDPEMQYTCAYYPAPGAGLEEAQLAKMEHVCRKLRLKAGETVVEAGCGWGGLARYMARHYGVTVRAYNISHSQVEYARRRAAQERLDSRVQFIEDDYRNIQGRFDAFVSVGMLEHVGADHYDDLGRVIGRCLQNHGRGLIHSIGQIHAGRPLNPWIRRRIFPGAYPPALSEMVQLLESADFSVLDVENLRLHYAKTLEHWLQRFEASAGAVANMFDERFVRMWRLYLAGSRSSFLAGVLHLFQIVFARPRSNDLPWTRAFLYAAPQAQAGDPCNPAMC